MLIRPVPQRYRGHTFRSTLEADWAATLDTYSIAWQYEPEAYQLPDGQLYRPDFYLPEIRTWLEVKGPHGQRLDKTKVLRFAAEHAPGCAQDCASHSLYANPWRMVLVGGPADADGVMRACAPNASTTEARCTACGRWQWSTRFADPACRSCGSSDVDLFAAFAGWTREQPSLPTRPLFGLTVTRAPRSGR